MSVRQYRRTDLDWLRIGAFALLILFHIGMFYAPSEWVVKSPRILPWLRVPLDWSSPWRLPLLFVVSGAATRFIAGDLSPGALLGSRSHRLLLPLIFTVLIVVPPQSYYQAVEQFGFHGSVMNFWGLYLGADPHLCQDGQCLAVPNWSHLWFVAYLWLYTLLLVAVLRLWPALAGRLQAHGRAVLSGFALFVVPSAVLIAARLGLKHFFPESHDLTGDWYFHCVYFLCFVFGFLFATSEEIWINFMNRRQISAGIGLAAWAVYAVYAWHFRAAPASIGLRVAMTIVYGIDQWAWVAAAFGYARRYLTGRDGPVRRYLTEAIFPYYIVHQTAIVVVAHNLAKLDLPLGLEFAILTLATVASCAATFEIVRRIGWLRPWVGLKRSPAAAQTGGARLVPAKPAGVPAQP